MVDGDDAPHDQPVADIVQCGLATISELTYRRNPDWSIVVDRHAPLRVPLTEEKVSAGFFRAAGTRLLRGRFFDATETRASNVVIVNETFARRFLPGEDAIGQRFRASGADRPWWTIVGVVEDMRRRGLEREVTAEFFEPQIQAAVDLLVRADGDPLTLAPSVRSLIRSTDPIATVSVPTTLDDRMSALGAGRRFETALLTVFAIIALILAAVGIYGVLRYTVVERRREIAVRSALGATPMAILRLIVGDSLRPAAAGVGLGILASLVLTRAMAGLLYGVSATDPRTFGLDAAVFLVAALAACALPGCRAARADASAALRQN